MWVQLLLFIAGLVLLVIAAEWLVRGSVSLARRLGITPLIIGLTVVAFGTSAPEMAVSVEAALLGSGALAIGNVVGSNIANIGLILGASALITPLIVQAQIIRLDGMVMIGASLLVLLIAFGGEITRLYGAVFVLALIAYVVRSIKHSRRQAANEPVDLPLQARSLTMELLLIIVGLGTLIFGADLMVDGAVAIANHFGISQAIIGLTIVAVGTSLPEVATSLVAAVRRQGDIAVGNIIGSNIFNLLAILGVAAMVKPLNTEGITMADWWVMLGISVFAMGLMRSGLKLSRWEGGLLLAGYATYIAYLATRL